MTTDQPTAPAFDVNACLNAVLEATRDKVAAARRIDLYRDRLDREARRRYAAEQSAPAWNTPKLGKVRLDPKPATAHVRDENELAAYVLGITPAAVTATLELVDATQLEEALSVLEFAGIKLTRSTATVQPAYAKQLLDDAVVVEAVPEFEHAGVTRPAQPAAVLRKLDDEGTLEPIPGTGVTPPTATLVVTLDAALKRETLARVDHELEEEAELDAAERMLDHLGASGVLGPGDAVLDELTSADATVDPLDPGLSIADRQRAAATERAAAIGDRLAAFVDQPTPETHAAVTATIADEVRPLPAGAPPYTARPRLGAGSYNPPAPRAPYVPTPEQSVEQLTGLTSDALKLALRRRGLPIGGRKIEQARRLVEAGETLESVMRALPEPEVDAEGTPVRTPLSRQGATA